MKESINDIIKKLEKASNLLHSGRVSDAQTAIYEAEMIAIFIRDNSN